MLALSAYVYRLPLTHESDQDGHHYNELDSDVLDDADQRSQKYDSCPHSEPNGSLIVWLDFFSFTHGIDTHRGPGFRLPAFYTCCVYNSIAHERQQSLRNR